MASFKDCHMSCLRNGTLFEDPDFPAENRNIFFSKEPPKPFVWKRPHEIVADPHLFVGGANYRLDITQGMLGDSWFLAALSSLSQYPSLLHKVIPPDYGFSNDYAGVFRVNFWQYGRWEEVVIDDRLPTYNNRLVFVHSKENNEFWSALVEKAYAKVNGSYEALKGGQTSEAMVDFTGGVTETYDLGSKAPENLFEIIKKSSERQCLMGCSISAKPNEIEAKLNNGLIKGHAYSVTGVRKVKARTRGGEMEVELVRVRNPWGNEREWTGPWGDKSSEWDLLSDEEKGNLGLTFEDDGEFWMSYSDWISNFSKVEICNFSPASDEDAFEMETHTRSWISHTTAGGCRNFPDTFYLNPQFKLKVEKKEGTEEDEKRSVVIALMQKGRRKMKRIGAQNLTIGFAIYKLDEVDIKLSRLPKDYFLNNKSTARSSNFVNSREITERFEFFPGTYCIIPSTFKPNEEGDFILRIYTEKKNTTGNPDAVPSDLKTVRPKLTREQSEAMDEKFRTFFSQEAGKDELIDFVELQKVLSAAVRSEMEGREVSDSLCRLLVGFHDNDTDGKLNFEEFKEMFHTFKHYVNEFKKFELDRSGDLNQALGSLGFKLSTQLEKKLLKVYANKNGRVSVDDFVEIVLKLQILYDGFTTFNGKHFSIDDFVEKLLY